MGRGRTSARGILGGAMAWGSLLVTLACGGAGAKPASPPCDGPCQDATAIEALRDAIKLAYNLTLQGQPVGAQSASTPCPLGGSAQIKGTATSNANQGSTSVALTYVFDACAFSQVDTDPKQNYAMTLTGTITENGTIAVQPSASTALEFASTSMTFDGSVYAPSIPYSAEACVVTLGQNGNDLSGTLCGRAVGETL